MLPASQHDVVIIGAGFAGLATALHLARRAPERRILLLEREAAAGTQSSGRNAGMIRQVTSEETVSRLARTGAASIRDLARRSGILRPTGSVLIAAGEKAARLRADAALARDAGLDAVLLEPSEARRRFPALDRAEFDAACHSPGDGVVDLAGLVRWYLEAAAAAGVEVRPGAPVDAVLARDGLVRGVRSGGREILAPVVVDAAGPWADEIGAMAGASPVPLRPRRRHVFVTEPVAWADPSWPFLWDVSTEVYFRPEEGGLLLSPCDEAEPGDKRSDAVDPAAVEVLRAKLTNRFPRLVGLPVRRAWSGVRTLTPDGRFVVGPDPALGGFFWVAGLGGHGVTASWSVGELAADLVLAPEKDAGNPHSPARWR